MRRTLALPFIEYCVQIEWSKICNLSYINRFSVFNFWLFFLYQVKRIRDMHNISLETAISFCVKIHKMLKTRMQIWPCFIVSPSQLAGDQSVFIISIDGIVKIINNKFEWMYRRRRLRRRRQWANRLILEFEMSTADKRFTITLTHQINLVHVCWWFPRNEFWIDVIVLICIRCLSIWEELIETLIK